MKKQELIHVHGLLTEISAYLEEKEDVDIMTEEYLCLDTQPTSVYDPKSEHKEAVSVLAELIAEIEDLSEKSASPAPA